MPGVLSIFLVLALVCQPTTALASIFASGCCSGHAHDAAEVATEAASNSCCAAPAPAQCDETEDKPRLPCPRDGDCECPRSCCKIGGATPAIPQQPRSLLWSDASAPVAMVLTEAPRDAFADDPAHPPKF